MGILDKAKFWKHDSLDLDSELPPLDSSFDRTLPQDPLNTGNDYQNPQFDLSKEIEPINSRGIASVGPPQVDVKGSLDLISSKLDTIKAELDSMNQRLQRLEKMAEGEQNPQGQFIKKDPWSNY